MRILGLTFSNNCQGWSLADFKFNKLTLLVGASGSGKSQTLMSINTLHNISMGDNVEGVEWDITFCSYGSSKHTKYRWKGAFQKLNIPTHVKLWENTINSKLLHESIYIDDVLLVERDGVDIIFKGERTVRLSQYTSLVKILKSNPEVSPIYKAFSKMRLIDCTTGDNLKDIKKHTSYFSRTFTDKTEYDDIEKIRKSPYPAIVKLDMAKKIKSEIYTEILDRFKEIFPNVSSIKMASIAKDEGYMSNIPFVQIKERGYNNWIPQFDMSSGMCRTLGQIAEMYLCREGTVFLIDEFENSLGVNCIEDLTNDVINTTRNLQFIISSHHAYIINNIDIESWVLVSRKGNQILSKAVADLIDIDSAHEYYMQLLQLDEYRNGRR